MQRDHRQTRPAIAYAGLLVLAGWHLVEGQGNVLACSLLWVGWYRWHRCRYLAEPRPVRQSVQRGRSRAVVCKTGVRVDSGDAFTSSLSVLKALDDAASLASPVDELSQRARTGRGVVVN